MLLDNESHETLVNVKRPGALQEARWMAKLLYCIKMFLLEHQIQELPQEAVTVKRQIKPVQDLLSSQHTYTAHGG